MDEEFKFLQLPDGRQISYREQGLNKQAATRSLLVLHGLGSSRIASMPGATPDPSPSIRHLQISGFLCDVSDKKLDVVH